MFDAKEIDFGQIEDATRDGGRYRRHRRGPGLCRGRRCGRAPWRRPSDSIDPDREVKVDHGRRALKECRKMLMLAKAGKRDGYLLEGMGCPGERGRRWYHPLCP